MRRALAVVLLLIATGVLAVAAGQAGGPPNPPGPITTFTLALDGNVVATSGTGSGHFEVAAARQAKSVEYRVEFARGLTTDTTLVDAFRARTRFGSATVQLYDNEGNLVRTYTFSGATITSFRHAVAQASIEEVVLTASSLTIT